MGESYPASATHDAGRARRSGSTTRRGLHQAQRNSENESKSGGEMRKTADSRSLGFEHVGNSLMESGITVAMPLTNMIRGQPQLRQSFVLIASI